MKKNDDQLSLNFADPEKTADEKFRPLDIKRAAIGWILSQKPDGLGISVPTRISKYRADIAAFWSSPVKGVLTPYRTAIIELRNNREQCWTECSKREEILPRLKEKKEQKRLLETQIRRKEPELKDTDNLLIEFESWHYGESKNKEYHRCLREIAEMEKALYDGSFFEQIRRACVADHLYLAVPAGTVHTDELADGWGLINIYSGMSAELVKNPENRDCPPEKKIHLVQNIASTCRKSLLFSFGIREDKNGLPVFTPVPRRRRKVNPDIAFG